MAGHKGAPVGNKNAAGHGVGKDSRTFVQKTLQSAIGIKRDTATGKLFVGKSLSAARAKDAATVKWMNTTKKGGAVKKLGSMLVSK